MPAERLSMRNLRELLRLRHAAGLSQHVIARSLGLAQGTISKYLGRARQAGLAWPLPPELDDDDRLEAHLFPPPPDLPPELRPKPDWAEVHRELRRPTSRSPCSGRSTRRASLTGSAIPGSATSTRTGLAG